MKLLLRLDCLLLGCVCYELLGLGLFLRGYFSIKTSLEGSATFADQPPNPLDSNATSGELFPDYITRLQ